MTARVHHLLRLASLVGALATFGVPAGLIALAPPAVAQSADVTLTNVRLGFGSIVYGAPRMVVRGTRLSQADWERILDPSSPEALADRTSRMDAEAIDLPEVFADVTTTAQGRQRTTYRNVRFDKVSGGRIAAITASDGEMELPQVPSMGRGKFGKMSLQELDVAKAVRLFAGSAGPKEPLQKIYGSFSLDDLVLEDGKGITTRVGRMSGRDFVAKPTAGGWMETLNALSKTPDMKAASPEDRKRSVDALTDLFDSIGLGTIEATDITFQAGDRTATSGKIGRVAFTGAADKALAEIRMDGIEVGSADKGKVKLGSIALGGLSMTPILEIMRDQDLASGPPEGAEAVRRMFAMLGSIRVGGVEAEFPSGRTGSPDDGSRAPPGRFSLGQFEFVTGKPVNGLPSDLRFALRNMAFPVPANSTDKGMMEIASLGYERVDASIGANLGWNEAGQEIVVREISLDGADMGSAILRGVIGNVSRDAFSPDTAVASVALLGAAAKSAEIAVENRGLFERVVAREAKRQKRAPEDIRREYGMAAAVGIPAILGNSPNAKAISQAVARFVTKPGRLTIQARAKQPSGYGAADFAAGPDPASVLNALDITATAE